MQKIKELLQEISGTKVTVQDKILKTTVKTINKEQIAALAVMLCLDNVEAIDLKRSGTGITILVTLK